MSLQPVVENSINYGLEKMVEPCRITVTSTTGADCLYITVADNGPGIEKAVLDKLNQGIIQPRGLGIGLKNINERIKLIFGDQFGMMIASELGQGTRVILRLPRTGDRHV